jgi:hypothetical protein
MASNRLRIVQGEALTFSVYLTDAAGSALPGERLLDAAVRLRIRSEPSGPDFVVYETPDAARLEVKATDSSLQVTLSEIDTSSIALGAYFYQIRLILADGETAYPIDWTPVDVGLGGAADSAPPTFLNTVKINHDYPLSDDLRYVTPGGSPIENAQVRVYYKADYDAGALTEPVGVTTTTSSGRWLTPILVLPGYDYVVMFFKPSDYGPDVSTVTA